MSVVDNLNKGAAGGAVQWMTAVQSARDHGSDGASRRLDVIA